MKRLIQVGNLAAAVDQAALRRLFERHGPVRHVMVNRHAESGVSTGTGFVEMESASDASTAIAALHHLEHCGLILSVCHSSSATPFHANHELFSRPLS